MNTAQNLEESFVTIADEGVRELGFPQPGYVFAYGASNQAISRDRAFAYAQKYFGAEPFLSRGRSGQSYAISLPGSKDPTICVARLREEADAFIQHAFDNADNDFLLTAVNADMIEATALADIFAEATANVFLPRQWGRILGDAKGFNLAILGSPEAADESYARLDTLLADKISTDTRLITPLLPSPFLQQYASERTITLISRDRGDQSWRAVAIQETIWAADAILVCTQEDIHQYSKLLNAANRSGLPIRRLSSCPSSPSN